MQSLENIPDSVKEYISSLEKKIEALQNLLADLQRDRFGRKSEKLDTYDLLQANLFNEAEIGLKDPETLIQGHSEILELENVKSLNNRKEKRKTLPENLPRIEIIHDISEHQKKCSCGACLTKFGAESSEKLVIVPMKVYVEKHIRLKYICKECNGDERDEPGKIILTAENKNELLQKSIVTPEILSFALTSKFVDHIPFYRLSNILLRNGLEITRSTFSNWTISIYEKYKENFSFMKELYHEGKLIGIDETTLQVHNENGKEDTTTSYMWVLRGGTVDTPILKYIYRENRSAEFLVKYLQGYEGIIQTDGYSSYDSHFKNSKSIKHAACMAHARRYFEKEWKSNKSKFAFEILLLIKKLYAIEKDIRDKNLYSQSLFDEIKKIRQEKSKPIIEEIYLQLNNYRLTKNISIGVGKAISYILGQWDKLVLFLEHGEVFIDNNLVENAIRPFVLGRKNWLFSGSPKGAEASAFWYSIIETAKANKQEPHKFLLHLLKNLTNVKKETEFKQIFLKALKGDY
jgi:transposase